MLPPPPAQSHRHRSATAWTAIEENYSKHSLWSKPRHRRGQVHYSCPRGARVKVCACVPNAASHCHLHLWNMRDRHVGCICGTRQEDLLDACPRQSCRPKRLNSVTICTHRAYETEAPAPRWVALPCAQNVPWWGTRECQVEHEILPGLLLFNARCQRCTLAASRHAARSRCKPTSPP